MIGKAAWIGIFAVGLMAGGVPAGPALAVPATPALIAEVQAALDKGDAQQAANLADTGLKETGSGVGERGRLLLYRGLAQELLGAHDAAVGDFTQALATNALPPDERAQAFLQRGFLRDGQGRLDQASADYSAVIAMKGESLATALNNRANIYRRQNRLMEARRDYLAALSAGSGKPQYSYYGLGQIAEAQRDMLAARTSYARALAADPDYGLASERLAALGGAPDGVIADPDKVTLRAPRAAPSPSDAARGFKVAAEATREPDGTIVLRAPRSRTGNQRTDNQAADNIVLHPPVRASVTRTAPRPSAPPPPAPAPPVRKGSGVALRPSLAQPDRAPGLASMGPAKPLAGEVQLGAWRSQAEADAGWDKAKAKAPDQLGGLIRHVVAADLPGKGLYYRLRVSPAPGQTKTGLCDSLVAKGVTCLPVRD